MIKIHHKRFPRQPAVPNITEHCKAVELVQFITGINKFEALCLLSHLYFFRLIGPWDLLLEELVPHSLPLLLPHLLFSSIPLVLRLRL